jgi:cell division initiation protein
MADERAPLFPYYRSPAAIRNEVFSQRMRGLDPDEVHEYLDLLADQVQACERERSELFDEIDRLRGEVARLGGSPAPAQAPPVAAVSTAASQQDSGPRAALLLSQAQQVADQLVEEAVAHARDLLAEARQQQREILEAAHRAAESAAREAAQVSARNITTYVSASSPEVEYARRFTRVAQVQLRSVLEALCEQVEQLGQVSRLWQQSPLAAYAVEEPVAAEPQWDVRIEAIPAQSTYRVTDALRDPPREPMRDPLRDPLGSLP